MSRAIYALGKIGDPRAIESLIKILKNLLQPFEPHGQDWNPIVDTLYWSVQKALMKIVESNMKGKERENIIRFLEHAGPGYKNVSTVIKGASMALKKLGHEV